MVSTLHMQCGKYRVEATSQYYHHYPILDFTITAITYIVNIISGSAWSKQLHAVIFEGLMFYKREI